ncbi:hypothetical protein GCM10028781_00900 [Nostocoides australiense]
MDRWVNRSPVVVPRRGGASLRHDDTDPGHRPAQVLWHGGRRRRARVRGRAGGDRRDPRPERRRQDHHRGLARENEWQGAAYLLIAWGLVITVQWLNPNTETWILFFALFPQTWALLSRWRAFSVTILVTLAIGVVQWWQSDRSSGDAAGVIVSTTLSLVLSLGLGLFIATMADEASARAKTIDELRAAQAKLAAAERESGVAQERERLSREIHDTLAQGFTSVLTLTRAARAALGRGDVETAIARLDLIEQTAGDNLHEARLMVAELTPGHLQSRSLAEALERLAATVGAESGLRVEMQTRGMPIALGGATDVVLLRTAQEAITNARRHSAARHVTMQLVYGEDVRLIVTDDGRGFDTSTPRRGFGLDGIQSRAQAIGGTVEVRSAPDHGTTIDVALPAEPDPVAAEPDPGRTGPPPSLSRSES